MQDMNDYIKHLEERVHARTDSDVSPPLDVSDLTQKISLVRIGVLPLPQTKQNNIRIKGLSVKWWRLSSAAATSDKKSNYREQEVHYRNFFNERNMNSAHQSGSKRKVSEI